MKVGRHDFESKAYRLANPNKITALKKEEVASSRGFVQDCTTALSHTESVPSGQIVCITLYSYPSTVTKQTKMKQYIGNGCVVELPAIVESKHSLIESKIGFQENENKDDAFFVFDLGDIVHKYANWVHRLPRVKPFYAVKCNDDHAVLKILADLGASFDCASKAEIQKILNLDVDPSRIIYANPCKQTSFIKYSASKNVRTMTFDNEAELYKIKTVFPSARLVLRILPPSDFKVQCELGMKFGCHPKKASNLLSIAKSLGLDVVGVSFHVGSGCEDAQAFAVAIEKARDVFDLACNLGFNMELLDIGGGYPGHDTGNGAVTFQEMADVINTSLEKYFPEADGVKVIAEPGRYFAASALSLAVNVIAKRVVSRDRKGKDNLPEQSPGASDEPAMMYYINDGVYGSFNCLLYDHAAVTTSPVQEQDTDLNYTSSIWGPTCDGLDCILEECQLPELGIGDWLYFDNMGAYTVAAGSTFNGMPRPRNFYYCQADIWYRLYPETACKVERSMKTVPQMKAGRQLLETADPDIEKHGHSPIETCLIGAVLGFP
ncbi:hypothetical protein ScPMuIL_005613 [Solemya velum]